MGDIQGSNIVLRTRSCPARSRTSTKTRTNNFEPKVSTHQYRVTRACQTAAGHNYTAFAIWLNSRGTSESHTNPTHAAGVPFVGDWNDKPRPAMYMCACRCPCGILTMMASANNHLPLFVTLLKLLVANAAVGGDVLFVQQGGDTVRVPLSVFTEGLLPNAHM
jgi:hypothetical protein